MGGLYCGATANTALELRLPRLLIRDWRPDDTTSLVIHANNRNVWINVRDRFPHPYTLSDAEQRIQHATNETPRTHFAIVLDGAAIGAIGVELSADIFRKSAEIGYWLGESFWGRGLATDAVRAMTDYAFLTFDLRRISAGVFEWNPASMRVLEKAGYVCEGRLKKSVVKDGRIIDQLVYAITRDG